jgi:hypothetical protein
MHIRVGRLAAGVKRALRKATPWHARRAAARVEFAARANQPYLGWCNGAKHQRSVPVHTTPSRREFLTRLGLAALAVPAAAACGKQEGGASAAAKCDDTTGLDDAAKATRTSLAYREPSPDPAKACEKCLHFIAPEGGAACGGCKLFKGTVAAGGTCNGFVVKPA